MKRLVCALALALLVLPGCKKQSTQPVVGVTLLTQTHDFYKDLEQGLKEEAKKRGLELVVTSAEFKPATQASQIEDLVARHVAALVVAPCDSMSVGKNLEAAEKANIPVFTADISSKSGKITSHIASDNIQGGRLAAEAMGKFLHGKGKVIVIDHPIVASVQDRVRGFEEGIKKFPDIQIVAKPAAEGRREKALAVMEDMLQAHPDVNGVFGINDDSALGALSAVKNAGKNDIVIIGYDAIPEARAAISKGTQLKADVVQDPKAIGQKTIEMISRHLAGEAVPAVVPVDVKIVDQESLQKQ
jgi:ribose transport system substrate-binding protein